MANKVFYGIQWASGPDPGPDVREYRVATGKDFNINGSSVDMNLNTGDPLTQLNTEYLDIAEGSEASGGTADTVLGIMQATKWHWNVALGRLVPSTVMPSGIVWGTVQSRASIVSVLIPRPGDTFYIRCDEAVTATTFQAYMALRGEACDHVLSDANAQLKLNPLLDISTHGSSSGQWQIVGVPGSPWNNDFAATGVVIEVRLFEPIAGVAGVLV